MRHISIRSLMAFVVVAAVGFAALRNANEVRAGIMPVVALAAVGASSLGAIILRSGEQYCWLGFALFTAFEEFALSRGGKLAPAPGGQPFDHLILTGEDFGPITIMYPGEFYDWDDASAFLSKSLGVPVVSLHIHDGDLWMYILYRDGEAIDQFNPIPDYWSEELSAEERSSWAGDAGVVCGNWEGVERASIRERISENPENSKHLATTVREDLEAVLYEEIERLPTGLRNPRHVRAAEAHKG